MDALRSVGLVVPAYNEARSIVATVSEARDYLRGRGWRYDIVVAADGDDGTREAVAELGRSDPGVRVIGRPGRRGKGRGVRDGMALVDGDVVGFIDADNKTPIAEFDKMLPHFLAGRDMVIGSRGLLDSRIEKAQPLYRRLGSKGFGVLVRALLDFDDIRDTQCGFKFFRREAARRLFALQTVDGYLFDIELIGLARHLGLGVAQVPVRWRDDGDSRLDVVTGNLKNLLDLFRIRARLAALGQPSRIQ